MTLVQWCVSVQLDFLDETTLYLNCLKISVGAMETAGLKRRGALS